jgi:hypothetical protein
MEIHELVSCVSCVQKNYDIYDMLQLVGMCRLHNKKAQFLTNLNYIT